MSSYDPIAQSIYNYHFKGINKPVIIHADDFDDDEVLPSYFFRTYSEMPDMEKKALDMAFGSVLDVGACAGCHSIYLQEKGIDVYSLEKSSLSCDVLTDRKLPHVICEDLFAYKEKKFDTILLLMNGTGIAGKLNDLTSFLIKLKSLLEDNGKILIDSSDLIFLYLDDDGSGQIDLNSDSYYGELTFQTEYENEKGESFPWLYVDKDSLAEHAFAAGLKIENIIDGEHYDYLAIIKHA